MKEKGKVFTWIKNAVLTILTLLVVFFVCGYLLSFVGWYGGMQWRDRVGTDSLQESRARNVLVKELHYKVVGYKDSLEDFHAYIERGFRYGVHSSGETHVVDDSQFPYQFNFSRHPGEDVDVTMRPEELKKFDSLGERRGYLRNPAVKDTISLIIEGDDDEPDAGKILVWD